VKWVLKRFENLSPLQIYKILELRYNIFNIEQQSIYKDIDGRDINAHHLFLEDGDRIIAYLRIIDKGAAYDEVSIGRVLVDERYRSQGISREMLLLAMDFIKDELNTNRIIIFAQKHLVEFYEGLKFKVISEPYIEANVEHIKMLYDCSSIV
jgi:ElaA protein